jgi:hypothetical protein
MSNLLRKGLTFARKGALPGFLVLSQIFPAWAVADLLVTNRDINVRGEGRASVVGWLAAGSIVEVDRRYVVEVDGKPNVEATLRNWLVSARFFDGGKRGYFYPVKISWTKPGSDPRLKAGDAGLVALRYLQRRKSGPGGDLRFITTEEAEVIRAQGSALRGPSPASAAVSPAAVPAPAAAPVPPSAPVPEAASALDLSPASAPIPATARPARAVYSNCGVPAGELLSLVARAAEARGVPAEEMLAIKRVESNGNCRARHQTPEQAAKGLASVGPLQIEVKLGATGEKRACNSHELEQITELRTPEALALGPKCVNNPAHAAKLAVDIYLEHEATLKQARITCRVPRGTFVGFPDMDRYPEFKRQILRSAYNGGPCWAAEAAWLATEINRQEGRQVYDIYRWPDIRAAMLLPDSRRKTKYAHINIAYVEQVGLRSREIAMTLPAEFRDYNRPGARRLEMQSAETAPDSRNPILQRAGGAS